MQKGGLYTFHSPYALLRTVILVPSHNPISLSGIARFKALLCSRFRETICTVLMSSNKDLIRLVRTGCANTLAPIPSRVQIFGLLLWDHY